MKKILLSSVLALLTCFLYAQERFVANLVYNSEISPSRAAQSAYGKSFSKFALYQLDTKSIENHLQNNSNEPLASKTLHIRFGDKDWKLNLKLHDIRSAAYVFQENTENGLKRHPKSPTFTYRGYNGTNEEDRVVLAIKEGLFDGYVKENGVSYFIESAKSFDKSASADHFIIYQPKDVRRIEVGSCGQNATLSQTQTETISTTSKKSLAVTKCAEMGVAYDQSFKNKIGASTAESTLITRLNLVSDHYEQEFNIEYKVATIYSCKANEFTPDSNTESCKEGGGTCQDGTVLKEFANWGNSPDGFGGVARDVATFWTGRNLKDGSNTGNIGYSFFAGICNGKGYNIVEDFFTTGNNAHASIWIHELGHTWNAYHVANNKDNMMSPSIYGNSSTSPTNRTVTSSTRNSINSHRDSRTCLADGCTNVSVDETANDGNIAPTGFPNPFNAEVTINYVVNTDAVVKLHIYDALGQLVFSKDLGKKTKGKQSVVWNGKSNAAENMPTGFYFANITVGSNELKNVRLVKLN